MFRRGFFVFRLVGMLVLIALLVGGGSMLFRAGEAQGYAMGLNAAGKDLPVPAPYYGYGARGWMAPHFSPFGPLLGLFFFGLPLLFVFFAIGGFFRRMAWGHGPHHGHPWGDRPWGPPPWAEGQQPPASAPQQPPPAPEQPK